jgi:hypothetical protein
MIQRLPIFSFHFYERKSFYLRSPTGQRPDGTFGLKKFKF